MIMKDFCTDLSPDKINIVPSLLTLRGGMLDFSNLLLFVKVLLPKGALTLACTMPNVLGREGHMHTLILQNMY